MYISILSSYRSIYHSRRIRQALSSNLLARYITWRCLDLWCASISVLAGALGLPFPPPGSPWPSSILSHPFRPRRFCLPLVTSCWALSLLEEVSKASPYLHKGPFLQQFSDHLLNPWPASLQNPGWYPWYIRTFNNTPYCHASCVLPNCCIFFTTLTSSWHHRMS